MTHAELVALGAKWLRAQGFPIVATELRAAGCREIPDVVGFRSTCCAIIEAKVTRRDFLADAKKPERTRGAVGVGLYRFYLAPPAAVEPDDLAPGWGLIHEVRGKLVDVRRPRGNFWPREALPGWAEYQHPVDAAAEHAVLFSIARRLL